MSMQRESAPGGDNARMGAGAIATIIGVGLLVVFMVQNTADTRVKFLWFKFVWPLWLVILVSAVVGAIIWLGLGIMRRHRRRRARRAAR